LPIYIGKDQIMSEKKFTEEELAKIHTKAMSNYQYSCDFWAQKNQRSLKDYEFITANQWDDTDLRYRDQDDKPTLTVNLSNRFFERITNAFKKLQLEVKINPQDNYKDKENSQILQGLMKCIEMDSSADVAYATANEFQTAGGYGFVRVLNEYEDDAGFDQIIKIDRIKDPYSVLIDPTFKTIDGSDAKFAFIVEDLTKDEFEEEYGEDAEACNFPSNPTLLQADWFGETVKVAEYYLIYKEKTMLLLLSDGSEVYQSDVEDAEGNIKEEFQGFSIMASREIEKKCVYWFKMNGLKILDYTKIPTKYIPVVIFLGKEVINGLKRDFYGIAQYLRDLQRQLNYCVSLKNELIAMAPKAPWICANGQTEKYGDMWDNANTYNYSRLIYDPVTLDNGLQAPPPARVQFGPDIAQLIANESQIIEQMKAITGIYDIADTSQLTNDTSGKAILLKQESTENINISYIFNAKKSIEQIGKIVGDMAPQIYGSKQFLRIVGNDGTVKNVKVPPSLFDYNLARFDLTFTTGKSYSNLQSEAADQIMGLMQYMPQDKSSLIIDELIGKLNIQGSEEIQARLKRSIPPEILGDGKNLDPAQAQAMLASQKQQMDGMAKELEAMSKQLADKKDELDNKIKIASMDNDTKRFIGELEARTKMAESELKAETNIINSESQLAAAKINKGEDVTINPIISTIAQALSDANNGINQFTPPMDVETDDINQQQSQNIPGIPPVHPAFMPNNVMPSDVLPGMPASPPVNSNRFHGTPLKGFPDQSE
jgi:hypothetical protein